MKVAWVQSGDGFNGLTFRTLWNATLLSSDVGVSGEAPRTTWFVVRIPTEVLPEVLCWVSLRIIPTREQTDFHWTCKPIPRGLIAHLAALVIYTVSYLHVSALSSKANKFLHEEVTFMLRIWYVTRLHFKSPGMARWSDRMQTKSAVRFSFPGLHLSGDHLTNACRGPEPSCVKQPDSVTARWVATTRSNATSHLTQPKQVIYWLPFEHTFKPNPPPSAATLSQCEKANVRQRGREQKNKKKEEKNLG